MTILPLRMYRCAPPGAGAAPFETAVISDAQGIVRLYSTRSGSWQRETNLSIADMVFPMFACAEWDIEPIAPRQIILEDSL